MAKKKEPLYQKVQRTLLLCSTIWIFLSLTTGFLITQEVYVYSQQDYKTFYDILEVGIHSHQVQSVVQNTDDQDTDSPAWER